MVRCLRTWGTLNWPGPVRKSQDWEMAYFPASTCLAIGYLGKLLTEVPGPAHSCASSHAAGRLLGHGLS